MLQDRHPNDKVFEDILFMIPPADTVLIRIDHYLEDEKLYQLVKADLAKR
jgi:hypothetical protein